MVQQVSREPLIHLTDQGGKQRILEMGVIIGTAGIYAVPADVATEPVLWKVLRTGLSPWQTTDAVEIPPQHLALFRRALPVGPYSTWKRWGEVYFASACRIAISTDQWDPTPRLRNPRVLVYGPDVVLYAGLLIAVVLRLYAFAA
jgi:hypothetical protein